MFFILFFSKTLVQRLHIITNFLNYTLQNYYAFLKKCIQGCLKKF